MILDETVLVRRNNRTINHWRSKGYVFSSETIEVKPSDLPDMSCASVNVQCDVCLIAKRVSYKLSVFQLRKYGEHKCNSCVRAALDHSEIGKLAQRTYKKNRSLGLVFRSNRGHRKKPKFLDYCSRDYLSYKRAVIRLTNRQDLSQVANYDPNLRGRCGVSGAYQIDHKVSILEGYKLKKPIEEIANISNLQFIPWEENLRKSYN